MSIMISIVIVSMTALLSADTSAESATATVTVGSACTLAATVNTAHTAEVPAGSSQTNIGSTTLNAICNDAGGYAIYAVGYTGNEYGNNKMSNGTNEFNTGTGTSASNWNMSLNQVTTGSYATTIDGGFGSYSNIPATFTKVAHRDSMTDPATGSSINLTYGAYISSIQAPGEYVGKVKFTMVHPPTEVPLQPVVCPSGKICYNPDGNDIEGTMGQQSVSDSATSTMLLAGNFSREGYGFAGWSDVYNYEDDPNANFYGPQQDITFEAGQYSSPNDGLSLYAVWIKSEGNLQDSTKTDSLCGSGSGALVAAGVDGTANLDSISALTDQRDGQTYAIAKLSDNHCWMIENLRIDAEDTRGESNRLLAQGYDTSTTYGDFIGLANTENLFVTNYTSPNSVYYSGTQSGSATIDINTVNDPGNRMPRYNNSYTQNRADNPTSNTEAIYSYGNYYSWPAAIASTVYYETTNTNTSICPRGWSLPRGDNDSGGYKDLVAIIAQGELYTVAEKRIRRFPNNFLKAGVINGSLGGSLSEVGRKGGYWSSRSVYANNSNTAVGLRMNSYGAVSIESSSKYIGQNIRCIISN